MDSRLFSYFKISSIVLLICGIVFAVGTFVTKSTITVVLAEGTDITITTVKIDGETLLPTGMGGLSFKSNVGYGEHKIEVEAPGVEPVSESVSTTFRSSETITIPTLESASIEKIITEAYWKADARFINPKYFGNKDWIVFFVATDDGRADGTIGVARYNESSKKWTMVDEGTDFSLSDGGFENAPKELIEYLKK